MKRIALLGLVCFALSGCGDDKVTKEYLVGDWRCNWECFGMDSGREENYGNAIDSDEYIRTFKIVDDQLYRVLKDEKLESYDIDKIYNNPTYEFIEGDHTLSVTQKLEKISNDKYQSISTSNFKMNSNKTNVIDIKIKEVTICTRIK
ncbi:hypothetical protein [Gilliamella apicola]|uniref:hypothetical protein n=1 Tax=Gilliamella apicola TaxID=1196095 RepID=UPI002FEE3C89